MTSRVYTGARYTTVLRHLFRLIVGTAIWYLVTGAILQYEKFTEKCDGFATKSRTKCREHGGIWTPGFDISGHCFLLIYCSLLIAEEVSFLMKNYILLCFRSKSLPNGYDLVSCLTN
jgi:hypothetical protein